MKTRYTGLIATAALLATTFISPVVAAGTGPAATGGQESSVPSSVLAAIQKVMPDFAVVSSQTSRNSDGDKTEYRLIGQAGGKPVEAEISVKDKNGKIDGEVVQTAAAGDLSKAATEALQRALPGRTANGFEKCTALDNGMPGDVTYIGKYKSPKATVIVGVNGKVGRITEEISVQQLPKAVQDTVRSRYPDGRIGREVEKRTEKGGTTYKLVVDGGGSGNVEIKVLDSGAFISAKPTG